MEYLSNRLLDHTQILNLHWVDQSKVFKYFKWRQPQNIIGGKSQQPFIGSYSNFKLRLRWPKQVVKILQMKTTFHGRQPQNIKTGISQ